MTARGFGMELGAIGVALTLCAGCSVEFDPTLVTFACTSDDECAAGWRCVNPGNGPICARPVDGHTVATPDTGEPTTTAVADSSEVDDGVEVQADTSADLDMPPAVGDGLIVESDMRFVAQGDHLVQIGGLGKHYFVSADSLSLDDAVAYCQARTESGLSWSLARLNELKALSRCCLTRPDSENRCAPEEAMGCFFEASCAPAPECRGCGAPPDGCWWHPTFIADCDAYWAALPGATCAATFDFRVSEIVALDRTRSARVMCVANPR